MPKIRKKSVLSLKTSFCGQRIPPAHFTGFREKQKIYIFKYLDLSFVEATPGRSMSMKISQNMPNEQKQKCKKFEGCKDRGFKMAAKHLVIGAQLPHLLSHS